jgi:hypothetical protein
MNDALFVVGLVFVVAGLILRRGLLPGQIREERKLRGLAPGTGPDRAFGAWRTLGPVFLCVVGAVGLVKSVL